MAQHHRRRAVQAEVKERKETAILALRDDRPEGLVPSVPIAAITAVADMQKRGIDSGGGELEQFADLSRTAEAYLFACKYPGILLFKGQKRMSKPFSVTDIDRLPGTNKPLPGSIKLYNLNSKHFKDRLGAKLMISPTDPGAWHLHKDIDEDFAKQMCAEHKDVNGYYVCPKGKANYYWDCTYYELALTEIALVKFLPMPETTQAPIQQGRRVRSTGIQQ